jgi:haloacetate dehalogenase
MQEDYRAAASLDYELDETDKGVKRIQCPLLVWSEEGFVEKWYAVLSLWQDDVRGEAIEGRHYLQEETPEAAFRALHELFAGLANP